MTDSKLYDFDKILINTGGDRATAFQVIKLQLELANEDIQKLQMAIKQPHFEEIRKLAHKSKSGFMIMGADALYELAAHIETAAKEENREILNRLFVQFQSLNNQLTEELEALSASNN